MKSKIAWAGVLSLAFAGVTGVGLSATAWAGLVKPMITVSDPGGDNGPYVTDGQFTANGHVNVTEWAAGTKKPIYQWTIMASSSGDITSYGQCDGNNDLVFRAQDATTHKKTKKSAPAEYPCIN